MSEAVLTTGEAVIYGLIQGITEFLPISSDGHLQLAHLLGIGRIPEHLAKPFDVLLHAATLAAILVGFRREILLALRPHPRLWGMLLVAMIPTGIAGLTCKGLVEASGRWLWLVGVFYLYNAVLLFLADRARAAAGPDTAGPPTRDELCGVTLRQALAVGLLQVLALLPGVSRSGSTVAGGLFTGMRPGLAVGFSFLVGGPLIAAAAAKDALGGGFGQLVAECGRLPLAVASGVAFVSGLGAVWLLKLVTARRMLGWFALYCLLVALACLAGQFLAPAPEC